MAYDLEEEAKELMERFSEDVDVDESVVRETLEDYLEYNVPLEQAKKGTVSKLVDLMDDVESQSELLADMGGREEVTVSEFEDEYQNTGNGENPWVDVTAEVSQLWDSDSDNIAQVGLIDDGTEGAKFVSWETNDPPTLEEGQAYRFSNVPVSEYNGRYEISLAPSSEVEEVDEDFDTGRDMKELQGVCVKVTESSGLIKEETDDGEIEHHLRLLATVDDGEHTYMFELGEELTEAVTGISLNAAKELVQEHLDDSVVVSQMRESVLGHYMSVEGYHSEGDSWVNGVETASVMDSYSVETDELDELLVRARQM